MNRDNFNVESQTVRAGKGPQLIMFTDGETKNQEEKLHSQCSDRGLATLLATQDSSSLSTKPTFMNG